MHIVIVLSVIVFSLIIFGIAEYFLHQRRIYSIPIRIHINGTRGKSSVSRLIGAGLREAGIPTITKVTGTYPRLILEDGTETLIHRKSDPNILEQLSTVKFAASRKVKALVVECMALQPLYQKITERQMIHATLGVITNIRMDHLDVMGKSIREITETLSLTIPKNRNLFTAETNSTHDLAVKTKMKKSEFHLSKPESVLSEEMSQFKYLEHKENVSLALSVCEYLDVKREVALSGMYKSLPDAGALKKYSVKYFGKQISFYNAFAANDPESTMMIWDMIKNRIDKSETKLFLLNNRQDRFDRGRQLAEMAGEKLRDEIDFLMLIGDSTDVIKDIASSSGLSEQKIISLHKKDPAVIFERLLAVTNNKSSVIAIGNMGGMGIKVAEYFEHRDLKNHD